MSGDVTELVLERGRVRGEAWMFAIALLPLAWFPLNLALHQLFEASYMRVASSESGALELSQAAFYCVAALSAGLAARGLARGGERGLACIEALLAAGALLLALEETAWGQTLFDFTPPVWWRARNRQGELTLHNLRGVHEAFGYVAMVASFALAGAWAVVPRVWYARRRALALLVPPPVTTLYFLAHGAFIVVLQVQQPLLGKRWLQVSQQEVFETPLAAGVFIVAELQRRAVRSWSLDRSRAATRG